jgi:L-alanine-DL-glutamate epimerase-like enolase superfamily enzyme
MFTRREWLKIGAGAAAMAAMPAFGQQQARTDNTPISELEKPMFDLPSQIKEPVKIESIELLKRDSNFFVRTRAAGGAVGVTPTKQVEQFVEIFRSAVAPMFIGKDARQIETLINDCYRENYKLAGLAFWCPVAYVEQSVLDLLGKVSGKPVGALLGGIIRKEVPVYLSGSDRILRAEEEVAVYVQGVAETGAKAVKFKIGGRMSRNQDTYEGRTETVLKQGREKLGDKIILYADANGSYDAKKGIEIGKMMESLDYTFFEEPCPFEELSETQAVAKALRIPIAFGEQNFSLWQFQWMMNNGVMQIVQPDINYNGGLIRAARVARVAEKLGMTIVPHNTQTGVASVNILTFASYTKNIGPFMEYPWRRSQRAESWYSPNFIIKNGVIPIPTGPGLGPEIDPAYLAQAQTVAKIA